MKIFKLISKAINYTLIGMISFTENIYLPWREHAIAGIFPHAPSMQ